MPNKTIVIMRRITIGRNPDNNIVINDNTVSRYHCEIIQEANQIKLIDLNSSNGTFVNGRRVCGATLLNYSDSVRVSNVPIKWQNHFADNQTYGQFKPRRDTNLIVAVAVGAIALIAIAMAVVMKYTLQIDDIYFTGEYPQVESVYYSSNGENYYYKAFKGHVMVYFDEHTSYRRAKKIIEENGGVILSQIIDLHYFLVQVSAGAENSFIQNMELEPSVEYAFLHTLVYPCAVSAHVLDSTQIPDKYGDIHGQLVAATAMSACDDCVFAYEHNIADQNGDLSTHKATEYIKTIFKDNQDSPILINMSYGVYLTDARGEKIRYNKLLQDDSQNQQQLIDSWTQNYVEFVKNIIHAVKPYKDRDFVITKSAGNSGCPKFDKVVLNALEKELTPEEREIMDNHILLVSAYDEVVRLEKEDKSLRNYKHSKSNDSWWKISAKYANSPENYHQWVTTIDISHLTRKDGITIDGTSFAAPRALGYMARIIDEYDITAKEALQAVKKVTKENALKYGGAGMLDVVALDKEVKNNVSAQSQNTTDAGTDGETGGASIFELYEKVKMGVENIINPTIEPMQFAGVWIDNMQTIKLNLQQNDDQLVGYYTTTSHGGELDDPLSAQYLVGVISGDTAMFPYEYYSETSCRDNKEGVFATLKLLSDTKMEWTTDGGYGPIYLYRQDTSTKPMPPTESELEETTFYIKLKDSESFELSDGTKLSARFWTFGVGDLHLEISGVVTTPIKVAWRLDGSGMKPTSDVVYPQKERQSKSYTINDYVSFDWTNNNPVVNGVYITVSPLTEEERRMYCY